MSLRQIYSETDDGVPLAQIHSTTSGNVAIYLTDVFAKGKESEDDLVLNYCGIFNGTSYKDVRRELGQILLLQAVVHLSAERPEERPRDQALAGRAAPARRRFTAPLNVDSNRPALYLRSVPPGEFFTGRPRRAASPQGGVTWSERQ